MCGGVPRPWWMPMEDSIERLRELLSLHEGWFEAVRIRCVARKNHDDWWILRCDANRLAARHHTRTPAASGVSNDGAAGGMVLARGTT